MVLSIAPSAHVHAEKNEKPDGTEAIPLEKLSPKPQPPKLKRKESEEAAKRRLTQALATAPVLPPKPDMACKNEASLYCPEASDRDLYLCLGSHRSKLSRLCTATFRPYLTALIRTSCAADARIECSESTAPDAISCLLQEEAAASMPCRSALALWPRSLRSASVGAAQ